MDYSADFHHQLLQLEDHLLVGAGTDHSWTPNDDLYGIGDRYSESNLRLRDFDHQFPITDAESLVSSQGDDQKFAEILEEEASVSVSDYSPKIADASKSNLSTENVKKNIHRCFCSKNRPIVDVSPRKSLLPEPASSLEFDRSLLLASDHQLQHWRTSCRLTKLNHGITTQPKATCTLKQQKPTQTTLKKARAEPRVSCPPLKIRKEKLGDRIAALQQLVAPFGKTDTASVLMEAINYVNFLQNQIEMLTHSYMKSHRSTNYKTMSRGEINEEPERDLKARGLCLVPLACISDLPIDIAAAAIFGRRW